MSIEKRKRKRRGSRRKRKRGKRRAIERHREQGEKWKKNDKETDRVHTFSTNGGLYLLHHHSDLRERRSDEHTVHCLSVSLICL
jgi:hypothetical protein